MELDRWIALILVCICVAYGYAAFFVMDGSLAPFMRRNPIWPSTFPKVLSTLGVLAALGILFAPKKATTKEVEIDYRRLGQYHLGQAVMLLALMVVYALCLRPVGFLISTSLFLFLGTFVLGERRYLIMVPVSVSAALVVWFLVQQVLGIYMRPFPGIFGG